MKLTNLQIETIANRAYRKIISPSEYKKRYEDATEKVDAAWKEYKKTTLYKDIESMLNKSYVNSVSVSELEIAKSIKDSVEENKFRWHLNITKHNHEDVIKSIFERIYKPKDVSTSEIKESIILNSITVEDGTTVDDLIQNILDNFKY